MNNISSVDKVCRGCGGCKVVCPVDSITFNYNRRSGYYKPVVSNKCVKCGLCLDICPAKNNKSSGTMIGEFESIILAYSNDEKVRYFSTSGGVINSIVRYILEYNIVDSVIMVTQDSNSLLGSKVIRLDSKDTKYLKDTPRKFSSRYLVLPVVSYLEKSNDSKIAIIGTPCQIRATQNLIRNKKINNRIVIRIGITCSEGISYIATEQYKKKMGAIEGEMYYRGHGWPGKNTLITSKKTIEYDHLNSPFEQMYSSQIFRILGCWECNDHFAEESDLSFFDYWNKEELKTEKAGKTAIVIRSQIGKKIIEGSLENKYIKLERELFEKDIVESQLTPLKFKKGNKTFAIKCFEHVCIFVYRFKIYNIFSFKLYSVFARIFGRLCRSIKLADKE